MVAVSTMAASVPFILSHRAGAAPNAVASVTGFNSVTWKGDRQAPLFYSKVNDHLSMKIDNTIANTSSVSGAHFYQTEGFKAALPLGVDTVKASLYIDPAWKNVPVRAGLWGVSYSPSEPAGEQNGWPIIEFVNQISGKYDYNPTAFSGIRVWNTNTGDWYNLNPSSSLWGTTVTLQIAVNATTGEYEFYVNGQEANTATYSTEGYNTLTDVAFNNYNSALTHAEDYNVKWTNFWAGKLINAPTTISPNGWVQPGDVTFKWNAPTDGPAPVSYQLATGKNPNVDANGQLTTNFTIQQSDITGTSTTLSLPAGPYFWQVRARYSDGTDGPWSNVGSLTLIGAPTVTSPVAGSWQTTKNSLAVSWNAGMQPSLDGYNVVVSDGTHSVTKQTTGAGTSTTVDMTSLNQGVGLTVTVQARYKSMAFGSLVGPVSDPVSFNYDYTYPTVTVDPYPVEGEYVNGGIVTITGSVSDNVKFDYWKYQLLDSTKTPVTYSIAGGSASTTGTLGTINVNSLTSANTANGYKNGQVLPEGTYYVRVWADDAAMHQTGSKDVPNVSEFVVDRTAPKLTSLVIPGPSINQKPTITGKTNDLTAPVTITVGGVTYPVTVAADGTWSWTPSVELTPSDTDYSVVVSSTDEAQNTATQTGILTVVKSIASVPTFRTPTPPAPSTPTTGSDSSVLGDQTTTPSTNNQKDAASLADNADKDVRGASTAKSEGLAWYWWLLIILAVAALAWGVVSRIAARRNA